jgi:murein DD-endopeptidase MepM/ murein hydrolase activator NlpD
MSNPTRVAGGAAVAMLSALLTLPFLALMSGGDSACRPTPGITDDGTPSILGPSTLSVSDLTAWWDGTGKGQPPRLSLSVGDVISIYLSEGDAEGVRGDLAFAQAVHETGYFTNSDTAINNFAGIAHYDHAASGVGFPDALTGIRAQIQLLKKYAGGNNVALAHTDVSPDAGASATTWGGLAGTWASSTQYWTSLEALYQSMLDSTGRSADPAPAISPASGQCPAGTLALSGAYALPVERHWYDEHPGWFTKSHHDYPAADIPVPIGTPLYAVTAGIVASAPTSGRCGVGVVLDGDDGARYTYCHGEPGSQLVSIGDRVSVGQLMMSSASTGNSTGPHLHFGIFVDGESRCPQLFFIAIADGRPLDPRLLSPSGCTH